ncbi:MAG: NifB/NifX family molybdenum-iron cluster-binding protein [Chitinophagaceae bacterium]
MKIVVPVRGTFVDEHFGHCESFAIYTINENKTITEKEILPWNDGCGCRSNAAGVFSENGVTVALVGGLGNGALLHLQHKGIKVYRGASGIADELVKDFLNGYVEDSGIGCNHHNDENGHPHNNCNNQQ